jgi:integrase/recombinase XerD
LVTVTVYKRHGADCGHRDDRTYRRCNCRIWLEWNHGGRRARQSGKTRSWEQAQKLARAIELRYEQAALGKKPEPGATVTVERAISLFMASKIGEGLAENTIAKHKLTLNRLLYYCCNEGIRFMPDITLSHLTSWRAGWPFKSPIAKRNNQERVRSFFKFCQADGIILDNPAAKLTSIKIKADELSNTMPFEPEEMKRILAFIPKCGFSAKQEKRVRALVLLQRWSGLAIQDAVTLAREDLQPAGKDAYRIVTKRSKTGVAINNVIPRKVGAELLTVLNGNPRHFFWSGVGRPKSAVSYFQKLLKKVFAKAGIANGHSHRLRDTAAVEMLKHDVDIRKVSRFLGHTSVRTTEKYYAPWNKAQQEILDDDVRGAWSGMD